MSWLTEGGVQGRLMLLLLKPSQRLFRRVGTVRKESNLDPGAKKALWNPSRCGKAAALLLQGATLREEKCWPVTAATFSAFAFMFFFSRSPDGFPLSTLAPPNSAETHCKRVSWVPLVYEVKLKDIMFILILLNSVTLQLGGIYHCRCGAWITAEKEQ